MAHMPMMRLRGWRAYDRHRQNHCAAECLDLHVGLLLRRNMTGKRGQFI